MHKVRIRSNRRDGFADQVEPRLAIRTADPWRQVGVESLLVDPDLTLRRGEVRLSDKLRLDGAWVVGPRGRRGPRQ
jgi:hypothetical protein